MSQRQPLNSLYGFPTPLNNQALPPIVSLRTPTTTDYAPIGQSWIYTTGNAVYILVSIVSNVAQWNLLEAGGAGGNFTTLTSTGATTLATTGASVNTFGNMTGATSVTISAGTGGLFLDGAPSTNMVMGFGLATGTLTIGGAAQTGTITLGSSSGTNIVDVGTGAGATTVNIANGAAANQVVIGSTAGAAKTTLQAGTGGVVLAGNLLLSATGPQILFGAGAPSLTAPQGSLYLNTTGNSTSTRAYINTTGSTTWTAITTAA